LLNNKHINSMFNSTNLGKRAIVVGAGMGGLSAARVLADHFDEVVIVERDTLPPSPGDRRGVPQSKQPHGLLGGGMKVLEFLFPGFRTDLERVGAVAVDPGQETIYEIPNLPRWPNVPVGWTTFAMSRPLIEFTLRRRVERISNVNIRDDCKVLRVLGTAQVVSGLEVQYGDGTLNNVEADFVFESSGSGGLTIAYLKSVGLNAPKETAIGVKVHYSTVRFEIRKPVILRCCFLSRIHPMKFVAGSSFRLKATRTR
jgi:2-polyprenyl-6-methoxyphenol hydroxylase-like FAD-dependent oxidoreductase